jgi:membrane protein
MQRTKLRLVRAVLVRAGRKYSEDGCAFMAAGVSFYAFFALFPFALLALVVLAYAIDAAVIQEHIFQVADFYLLNTGNLVQENLDRMLAVRGQAGLISLLALFWASSGVFFALRMALNRVWRVPRRPSFLHSKLVDLSISAFFLLLLAATAVGNTAVRAAAPVMTANLPAWARGWSGFLVALSVTTALFALAYRIIPNARPSALAVAVGGAAAAAGFELARFGFTWYVLTLSPYQLVYGSLGAVIALLFWIYLSVAVFLAGAELAEAVDYFARIERPV